MQLFKKYGADIVILVVFAVLIAFLVAPWPVPSVSGALQDAALEKKVETTYAAEQLDQTSTGAITALFGVRPAPVRTSPSNSGNTVRVPETTTVSWIQYTGRVQKDNGTVLYYFKNKRTNKMLELNPDGSPNSSGWRLLNIGTTEYLLSDGAQKYRVAK